MTYGLGVVDSLQTTSVPIHVTQRKRGAEEAQERLMHRKLGIEIPGAALGHKRNHCAEAQESGSGFVSCMKRTDIVLARPQRVHVIAAALALPVLQSGAAARA